MFENDIEIDPLSKDFHCEKYPHFKDIYGAKYLDFMFSIRVLETQIH